MPTTGGDSDTLKSGRHADLLMADDGDNADYLGGRRGGNDRCEGDSDDAFGASCEIVYKDSVLQP